MPSQNPPLPSKTQLDVFERSSQAVVMHTAAFFLRHYVVCMRRLQFDSQAVVSLEKEAQTTAQHLDRQDTWGGHATGPGGFDAFSRALVMHTAAFLLWHDAITMRGLRLDTRAVVASLETAATALEQQMDEQNATFPDLLATAVLEILRVVVTSGDHWEGRAEWRSSRPIRAVTWQ